MAVETVQVTETMASFIDWAVNKGQEEIMRMIRERLAELKAWNDKNKPIRRRDEDGFIWDDRLEPNDHVDQWMHGGDCNLCRKKNYCGTKCKANKLLKEITTPFLYAKYIEEHPEAAAREAQKAIRPEDVIAMVEESGAMEDKVLAGIDDPIEDVSNDVAE